MKNTKKKRKNYHRYTYKEVERVKEAYLTHSDSQLGEDLGTDRLSIANLRARMGLIKPMSEIKDWVSKYKKLKAEPRGPSSITAERWEDIRAFFRHRPNPSLPSLQIKKIHSMIQEKKDKLKEKQNERDAKISPLES